MGSIENIAREPLLIATIDGPEVRNGHIEAEHLAKILDALQKSLRAFVTQQMNGSRVPPKQRTLLKKYTTLEVIGFTSGSFSINLTLPAAHQMQDSPLAETGRQALKAMVTGLRLVAQAENSRHSVNGTVARSLAPFAKMAPLLRNGIERIHLSLPGDTGLSAALNENVCRSLAARSTDGEYTEFKSESSLPLPETSAEQKLTADTLLHSPLVGIWSDRTDIIDSSEFARELRNKAGNRQR